MRRTLLRTIAVLAVASLALVVLLAINVVWFRPVNIDWFYERVFIELLLDDPELLSSLRIVEPFGITGHNAKLTDPSDERAGKLLEKTKRDLATLRSYGRENQSASQLMSTDILAWFLDDAIRGEPWRYHNFPVNQMGGVQSSLPSFMADTHMILSAQDAEYYLARLALFPWKFDRVLEGLRVREEKGIIPPHFVTERVLDEMRGFVGVDARENILYTSFDERLEKVESIGEEERARFLMDADAAIRSNVYPAYQDLIDYFVELEPKFTENNGAWALPDGDAFYTYQLRNNTTTDLTPEEVHRIGLSEVARIEGEMQSIFARVGRDVANPLEALQQISEEPEFLYANTDAGREEALAEYRRIIVEATPFLGETFDVVPRAPVEVRRIPEFKEKTSASHYNQPAMDGSRPGIFFARLYDMGEVQKFGMRTLVYHEAVPGHHFQIALAQEMQGVPTFRKLIPFTAYVEGWALYAEYLAREYRFYDDPYSDLGQLQSEMFRAVRLVVDTGIHYKRWTREQAIAYMMEKTGMAESDVTSEIERYFVWPGQACAYKIGQMKILELRERARTELGDSFDVKAFHNVVLLSGAVPLEILESIVEDFVVSTREKAAGTG